MATDDQRRRASQLKGYGEGPGLGPLREFADVGRGLFGAQPITPGGEGYRTGQALANMPAVGLAAAPSKIASALPDVVTGLGALGAAGVIKPKGGNWLAGSVERALEPLRKPMPSRATDAFGNEVPNPLANLPMYTENAALNKWINTKLTKYVKNEMGTPEDPIRALAERGTLHVQPENLIYGRHATHPSGEITPKLSASETAKAWENATDYAITPAEARTYLQTRSGETGEPTLARNPWLAKLPPETPVYDLSVRGSNASDLGFSHIIDELTNAMNPNSGLPASLRLTPQQLEKVTVPQAVERVAKINAWRINNKKALAIEETNKADLYKAYPEQDFRWIQLNKPGQFAAESDAMGHSVRGYEPPEKGGSPFYGLGGWDAIQSGKAKVYSLRDAKGQSHATIEVQTKSRDEFIHENFRDYQDMLQEGKDFANRWVDEQLAKAPQTITQIKGEGNKVIKDEYLPFVQDFVRSGNWSKVGDLQNTGLMTLRPEYNKDLVDAITKAGGTAPYYVTKEELDNLVKTYLPDQSYAHGGAVKLKNGGDPSMATDELAGFLSAIQEPEQRPLTDYEMRYALALDELRKRQEARSEVPSVARSSPDQQTQAIRDMHTRHYVEGMQPRSDTSQRFPPQPKSYADKLADATRKAYGALSSVSPTMRAAESMRPAAEVAATLGTGALAFPAAALYGVGRAGTEAARQKLGYAPSPDVNKDIVADAINAMTYEPKTESAQGALGAIAQGFEASKMPHLWPTVPGRPLMTPEAMQVAGARTGMRLGELRDIPADIAMQRQGLTRRNVMDEPTLGAQIGKGIDIVGEALPQQRQDLGLLLESQSGAIRPQGSRILQPEIPSGMKPEQRDVDSSLSLSLKNTLKLSDVPYTTEQFRQPRNLESAIRNAYFDTYEMPRALGIDIPQEKIHTLNVMRNEFTEDYVRKMFPMATDAAEAYEMYRLRFNTGPAMEEQNAKIFSEFLKSDELQKWKDAEGVYIPTMEEYEHKLSKLDDWIDKKVVRNYVSKFVGTEQDPMIQLIAKGEGPASAEDLSAKLDRPQPTDYIQQVRKQAGFPEIETPARIAAVQAERELEQLEYHLDHLEFAKEEARREAIAAGIVDPIDYPIFADTLRQIREFAPRVDAAQTKVDNLNAALQYEHTADRAVSPLIPEKRAEFIKGLGAKRFVYPHLDKVPESETLYTYYRGSNLQKLILQDTIDAITRKYFSGKLTDAQLDNLDFPKAVQKEAQERIARESKEKTALKQFVTDVTTQAKEDMYQFASFLDPSGKIAVVELDDSLPVDELKRLASMDTEVLNHCLAEGGEHTWRQHPFTLEKGRHFYKGIVHPVTGKSQSGVDMTRYIESAIANRSMYPSIRDAETGLPIASLQFHKVANGLLALSQVKGPNDRQIINIHQLAGPIADYLNTKAHLITNNYDGIDDLTVNTNGHIVDLLHEDSSSRIAQSLGVREPEVLKYDFSPVDGKRFVTRKELRDQYRSYKEMEKLGPPEVALEPPPPPPPPPVPQQPVAQLLEPALAPPIAEEPLNFEGDWVAEPVHLHVPNEQTLRNNAISLFQTPPVEYPIPNDIQQLSTPLVYAMVNGNDLRELALFFNGLYRELMNEVTPLGLPGSPWESYDVQVDVMNWTNFAKPHLRQGNSLGPMFDDPIRREILVRMIDDIRMPILVNDILNAADAAGWFDGNAEYNRIPYEITALSDEDLNAALAGQDTASLSSLAYNFMVSYGIEDSPERLLEMASEIRNRNMFGPTLKHPYDREWIARYLEQSAGER
jgi:hypothetical protein